MRHSSVSTTDVMQTDDQEATPSDSVSDAVTDYRTTYFKYNETSQEPPPTSHYPKRVTKPPCRSLHEIIKGKEIYYTD